MTFPSLEQPVLVGHLAPDLDCLAALWMLRRWGGFRTLRERYLGGTGK